MPDTTPAPDPRAPPSARTAAAVFREIATRWSDNDLDGHVDDVVHDQILYTAVSGWPVEERWLGIHHGETIGLVVETGCRYVLQAAFPDRIAAGIRVGRIGASSVRREVGLFRNEESLAFAASFFVQVYVNRGNGRPQPLAGPFRARPEEIAP